MPAKKFDVFIEETASRDGSLMAFVAIIVPSEETTIARNSVNDMRCSMKK